MGAFYPPTCAIRRAIHSTYAARNLPSPCLAVYGCKNSLVELHVDPYRVARQLYQQNREKNMPRWNLNMIEAGLQPSHRQCFDYRTPKGRRDPWTSKANLWPES